jgi:hypothetical protein
VLAQADHAGAAASLAAGPRAVGFVARAHAHLIPGKNPVQGGKSPYVKHLAGLQCPVPEELSEERARELRAQIETLSFVFAKTLAHIPHWYTTQRSARAAGTEAAYSALFEAVQRYGVPGDFQGYRYRYLYPGDGWKYWYIPPIPLINRARSGR